MESVIRRVTGSVYTHPKLISRTVPIALDPAPFNGALVRGSDGLLYMSDGVSWDWVNKSAVQAIADSITGEFEFAIVSNANGHAEQRASGWQVCKRVDLSVTDCNTTAGSVFQSAAVTWTFPAAFAFASIIVDGIPSITMETPVVQIHCANVNVIGATITSVNNSSVTFRLVSHTAVTGSLTIQAQAIGRWAFLDPTES